MIPIHTRFSGVCVSIPFGRALAWHARGHRFDPAIFHPKSTVLRWKCSAFLFASADADNAVRLALSTLKAEIAGALEHQLSAFDTSITHGAGLAVMMPAWMRFVWREDPSRFLAFADLVFGIEPVDETEEAVEDAVTAAIDELQAFFAELGMPTKLGEFGLKLENVDAFLATLKANKGEAFGGFKKITLEDARAIYESAF